MRLRHARTTLLGTVVAILLALLACALPASAVEEEPTYADVSAVVVDRSGNGRESELLAFTPDGAGGYTFVDSRYAHDGVFAGEQALSVPTGQEYRFMARDYRSYSDHWVGGDSWETASSYLVEGDLDLGQVIVQLYDVSGTVTRAKDGSPLAGIRVSLNGDGARTNSEGLFRFRNVQPGDYDLEVEDDHGTLLPESRHVVVDDQDVSLDLSMRLRPRITGTVRDAAGLPLRGVRVLVSSDESGSSAMTRRDGTYAVTVDPGEYRVMFSDPAGEYEVRYYDGTTDWDTARLVTASADNVTSGVDARLAAAPAPDPAVLDLTGRVQAPDGSPAGGLMVEAYDSEGEPKGTTFVRRDGSYRLNDLSSGIYRLMVIDENGCWSFSGPSNCSTAAGERADAELPFVTTWSGGKRSHRHATEITVVADAATPARHDLTVPQYGLIEGVVRGKPGAIALGDSYVIALDANDERNGDSAESDGRFRILVEPGAYDLAFFGESNCSDSCVEFIPEWYDNSPTREGAREVKVGSGQRVTGIDAVLTPELEALTAPSVKGAPVVGQNLTVATGVWNRTTSLTYDVTWLRGSTPVGTGTSYRVTRADAGQSLSVRVEAQYYDLEGTAFSAPVMAKHASTTTLTGSSPKKKVVALKATVAVPGVTPSGTITFYRGTTAVAKGVALVKGVASATVGAQPAGAQKYHAVFTGSSAIAGGKSAVATVTVRKK